MTEEFHDAGKTYASAEHECGVGVSKLMRDDPGGDSRRGGDFVQRFADSTKQHFPSFGPRQKEAIGWRRGQANAKLGGSQRVGRRTNLLEPAVRFSSCPAGHE